MGTRVSSYLTTMTSSQMVISTSLVTKKYSNILYGVGTSTQSTMTSSSAAHSNTVALSYTEATSSSGTLTSTTSGISSTLASIVSSYNYLRVGRTASYETFTIKSCSYTTYNTLARTSSF